METIYNNGVYKVSTRKINTITQGIILNFYARLPASAAPKPSSNLENNQRQRASKVTHSKVAIQP